MRNFILPVMCVCLSAIPNAIGSEVTGRIVDAESGHPLPGRLYVRNQATGEWAFAKAGDPDGMAVEYRKQIGSTPSVEMHTAVTAHPFRLELAPGRYTVTAELGKQFVPAVRDITVTDESLSFELPLERFCEVERRGWFSGDTHVHRTMEDLPCLVQAEDVNVVLPLNYWVRDSAEVPSASGPVLEPSLISVNPTHVIYPVNTEYEIFTVNGKRQTQGAVFVLNHRTPLTIPTPPARPVAEEARRQGAILDLDKHSWAWSMMIVPVMGVDLFELSNNHHWKTQFGFPQWTVENAPDWPEIERTDAGLTEAGWTEFGLQTYYALLNCGFRMRVSGGTGSGVHPVPLGYGRVFVHTGDAFSYDAWIRNLNQGHSFVTTGPLLEVEFDGQLPGTAWKRTTPVNTIKVTGQINSLQDLRSAEILVNGVPQSVDTQSQQTDAGTVLTQFHSSVTVDGSGWIAVRCFEDLPDRKIYFAHTNPVFVDVEDRPQRPRRRDAEFFVRRMQHEIARNTGVLDAAALEEYREALDVYQSLLNRARD